jgi:cyanophycin synthetase
MPDEVPNLLRDALLEHGTLAEQILIVPEEQVAVDAALREAQAGDLVLIFGDAITRSWKQVVQFRPDAAGRPAERTRVSRPEPAFALAQEPSLQEDRRREFVRDLRGVRLPRAVEEDD